MNRGGPVAPSLQRFPTVVRIVLAANVAVFVLQVLGFNATLVTWLALWPANTPEVGRIGNTLVAIPQFYPWQLLTYGFLHGGVGHIFFNLFALWMFGGQIENLWGPRRFAAYYIVCVMGAGLVQLLVVSSEAGVVHGPTLGASGGVFGVLLAYGMMFPNRMVMLLIPPIPMKAKWFVIIYGVVELVFGVSGAASGVAHFAHLGGMLFGFVFIYLWSKHAASGPPITRN